VIESFLASWDLFRDTYLVGWLMAILLALLGVFVVARDQVFLGAAVTQASTLGVALALALASLGLVGDPAWLEGDLSRSTFAVAFSLLATLVTARGGRLGGESHEAITGWVFLGSSSGAILLLAHSPHGLEQIHRLLASSLIGATRLDVVLFGALAAASALALRFVYRPLLLLSIDSEMAAAVGLRTALWNAALAVWLGLAVGLGIRVSGMLYTFGCLVLPALIARRGVRRVRSMLFAAPAFALLASLPGFVLANHFDLPPAQVTVALLAVLLALAWSLEWVRGRTGRQRAS
jgi:ABC-type Mn2+/Zn2+ transport system permease subunit